MAVHGFLPSDSVQCGAERRLFFERLEDRRLLSLTHLYTFNDGLANDWIGSAHGTRSTARPFSGGNSCSPTWASPAAKPALVQYARLGPNLLPAGDATLEVWFTTADASDWTRVFDIGNQLSGNGDSYLFFTPHSSVGDDSRARCARREATNYWRAAPPPTTAPSTWRPS